MLNERCINRIKELLISDIHKLKVSNDGYLDTDTFSDQEMFDKVLPKSGIHIENYRGWIHDTNPFLYYLVMEIDNKLSKKDSSEVKETSTLIDELNIKDSDQFIDEIVNDFIDLPRQYIIFFELPNSLSQLVCFLNNKYVVSSEIEIILLDDNLISASNIKEEFIKNKESESLLSSFFGNRAVHPNNKLIKNRVYLKINISGYFNNIYTTNTEKSALEKLKAFLGISILHGPLQYKKSFFSGIKYLQYYQLSESEDPELISKNLPDDFVKILNNIVFEGSFFHSVFSESLLQKKDKYDKTVSSLKTYFDISYRLFNDTQKTNRLLLAAEWFLESYISENDTMSFVQLMIVIEVLIGDKTPNHKIPLMELLSNRLSYLLSERSFEREELIKKFEDIYNIRSKIVHTGKSKLVGKEFIAMNELRKLCLRLIRKEIQLLTNVN